MSIIIIAAAGVEPGIESLIDQYDNAKSPEQQEQIAADLFNLVGDKIRSMISFAAKGHQLSDDDINSLAMQALYRGLNESGMPRFNLKSAADRDWQPQIQQMLLAIKSFEPSPAARIWSMLSGKTQSAILANPKYVKAAIQNQFLADVNSILRRRDLYTPLLWHRESLPLDAQRLLSEGIEKLSLSNLARLNSMLIGSAFSGVEIPMQPKRNLLGYISSTVVPQMKPTIWETATGRKTDLTLVEAWSALKDDFAAVEQMRQTGTLPDAWQSIPFPEQILQHYRQRISVRFGPVINWWNARVKELQPHGKLTVHDGPTLRAARELFEKNSDRVPETLWKDKGAQFFVPLSVFQPYGRATVERLMATEGFAQRGSPATDTAPRTNPIKPTLSTGPANDAMRLLEGGHQSSAYRWFIGRFFSSPGFEAEKAVGVFLTFHPTPSNQQIQSFLDSLPEDLGEQIESVGFRNLARQMDERLLEAIQKPEIRNELEAALGQQRTASASILNVRRNVFLRTAELILSRAG